MASICPDHTIVAQQLAHIELERMSMIGPDELVELMSSGDIEDICQVHTNITVKTIKFV